MFFYQVIIISHQLGFLSKTESMHVLGRKQKCNRRTDIKLIREASTQIGLNWEEENPTWIWRARFVTYGRVFLIQPSNSGHITMSSLLAALILMGQVHLVPVDHGACQPCQKERKTARSVQFSKTKHSRVVVTERFPRETPAPGAPVRAAMWLHCYFILNLVEALCQGRNAVGSNTCH